MRWLAIGLSLGCGARAAPIPPAELDRTPTVERVAALQAEAAGSGWKAVAQELRGAAAGLYEQNRPAAQAWYYLYRWADWFGQTEAEVIPRWIQAVQQARAGNPNMATQYRTSPEPLADAWPAELQAYAMGSADFSEQFFTLLSPLDQPAMVQSILADLWRRNPAEFKEYASLALAIAVVYDVSPPPDWPHGQVGQQALSRQLPSPAAVFGFFVRSDRAGATLYRLRQLPAADLKFVVDTTATFEELTWAQKAGTTSLATLGKLYDLVRYRRDRLVGRVAVWPLPTYRLPEIVAAGGICVDQAYFAATVGKGRGVPTLLFRGAGLDGRHAWFGYLSAPNRWTLDCGRYAEQKLIAGYAFDPQTWTNISDHEIAFLSEGFRRLPLFRTSLRHAQFAELYFAGGDFAAAARAARSAVNVEPRNLPAWVVLIGALQRRHAPAPEVEGILQEAARAFQRYPDLEAEFRNAYIGSLRARGETSLADQLERGTAQKYAGGRQDLSAQEARDMLRRSIERDSLDDRIRTFYRVLKTYGPGAGMDFYDQVVAPFVDHLLQSDRPTEAVQAVAQARRTLRVEANGQLDAELNALAERARKAQH